MIYNRQTIQSLPVVVSLSPPAIASFVKGDKRYAVYNGSQGRWVEITKDVTLEDVTSRWKRWSKTLTPEEKQEKKKSEKLKKSHKTEWQVPGSKGNEYKVTLKGSELSCECVGFGFRRKCKHVEKIKNEIWES